MLRFGRLLVDSVLYSGDGEGASRLRVVCFLSTIFQSFSGFILTSFMTRDPGKLTGFGASLTWGAEVPHRSFFFVLDGGPVLDWDR